MVMHPSIPMIKDNPSERELFRLVPSQTSLNVALYTKHDTDAALHFLNDRAHHSQWGPSKFSR